MMDEEQFEYEGAPPKRDPGAAAADALYRALPQLASFIQCPSCGVHTRMFGVVMHLNDYHKMPREDIADWLDALNVDLSFPVPEDL